VKSEKEIRDWLLENAVDDNGDLNLKNLDFSDFDGDVHIGGMKVKNTLYQYGQNVGGDLYQLYQKVKGDLWGNSWATIKRKTYEVDNIDGGSLVIIKKERKKWTSSY